MRTTHATAAVLVALALAATAPAQCPGGVCHPQPAAYYYHPAPAPVIYYQQPHPLPAPAYIQWAGPVQYVQQQPAPAVVYWHVPTPLQACPGGVCRPAQWR